MYLFTVNWLYPKNDFKMIYLMQHATFMCVTTQTKYVICLLASRTYVFSSLQTRYVYMINQLIN